MATYNYIKAVWKNGPSIVSDGPEWVVDAIERTVPIWMSARKRSFVGVQFVPASGLTLGIFVSPGASSSEALLEDGREGSFVHVFATDFQDCMAMGANGAQRLFESVYGSPLSDAALRQERNYGLLHFPEHRELANDLFVPKDLVEGDAPIEREPVVEADAPRLKRRPKSR